MPEGLDVRACPACGEPMTRPDSDEGCMTMRCPNCTHYFDWKRALVLAAGSRPSSESPSGAVGSQPPTRTFLPGGFGASGPGFMFGASGPGFMFGASGPGFMFGASASGPGFMFGASGPAFITATTPPATAGFAGLGATPAASGTGLSPPALRMFGQPSGFFGFVPSSAQPAPSFRLGFGAHAAASLSVPAVPLNADGSLLLTRRQLGIIPDGVVGTIVEDQPDHTWCNSACVVASTRRDWIAVVTSNDGTHARWNPVLARLILSPVCGRLEVLHSGPAGKCTRASPIACRATDADQL
jgi:hypothetical protein